MHPWARMASRGSPSSTPCSNRRKPVRAGSPRKAFPIGRNRLGIDEIDGQAATEDADRLLGDDGSHALHRLLGDAGKMGGEDYIIEAEERMIGRQRLG